MSNLHRIQWIDARIRDGRYPNCTSISREFSISVRQASRDVEYLKYSMGAPVEYSKERNGYHYTDPTFVLPAFILAERERELLGFLAARYAQAGGETGRRLADLFSRLSGSGAAHPADTVEIFPVDPGSRAAYEVLEAALRTRIRAEIVYRRRDGARSRRPFAPYRLFTNGGVHYAVGHCSLRGAVRTFRLDRIEEAALTDESYVVPADFVPEHYKGRIVFREPYRALVVFGRGLSEEAVRSLHAVSEGAGYAVTFTSSSEVLTRLVSTGRPFEIIAPEWLRVRACTYFALLMRTNS